MKTYIVSDFESYIDFKSYVTEGKYEYICLDFETDSVIEKKANVYGIGLCFEEHEAFYIPIRDKKGEKWWQDWQEADIVDFVYALCKTKKLIGHNIIYDVLVFENNFKKQISDYIYADTILMKHCIDEDRPFGLKEVAVKYLGTWADKAQKDLIDNIKANGGSTTKENMEMCKADTDVLGEYCAYDVLLTMKLFNLFSKKLKEENLEKFYYEEEVIPLYKEVTIPMKRKGFPVDVSYFQKLEQEITEDIKNLEDSIQKAVEKDVSSFCTNILNENYPVKKTGNFPKAYAALNFIELPTKDGNISLAKGGIKKLAEKCPDEKFYKWLLGEDLIVLDDKEVRRTQEYLYFQHNENTRYIFNLKSNEHLSWLLFDKLDLEPLAYTEKNEKPKCDDEFLESIKEKYEWIKYLVDYKKLMKLKSTYVEGILERQVDGIIYSSMLQFGTTSGRFSSREPNLQNLPRIKDEEADLTPKVLHYVNAIKKGFVAGKEKTIVNADYSQLEPVCFSAVSGDKKLQEVFHKKQDLYCAIAIEAKNLTEYSADKKAKNYLKNFKPELRHWFKTTALAVVYGAEANRIADILGIHHREAQQIIDDYLDAYPNLRKYMQDCDIEATKNGFVKTRFGRVRHLPHAKQLFEQYGWKLLDKKWSRMNGLSDLRYTFKNALNNAKNFKIQGLGAHIVNRAAIAMTRQFKKENLEAFIAAQVHDELTVIADIKHATRVKEIMKTCMENTVKLEVPLVAEPIIAPNWAEAK